MLEGVRVCSIDLQDNRLTILSEKVFRPIIDFTAASAVFWTSGKSHTHHTHLIFTSPSFPHAPVLPVIRCALLQGLKL